jgi:hypothetical protein
MKRTLTQCPLCDSPLSITELFCGDCGTTLKGDFPASQCVYGTLPEDQSNFLELFLRCRGNLRDVERSLGLSYPTVRARLDQVLSTLGFAEEGAESASETSPEEMIERRREILQDLDKGQLSPEEAVQLLQTLE